jgi:hypothetical protein
LIAAIAATATPAAAAEGDGSQPAVLSASDQTANGTPPTVAINGPSGTIYTATASFTLAASDPAATLQCSLDGAPYAPCGATYTTAPLSQGPHTLAVRAAGAAGLGPEVSRGFDVDLAGAGTILSGPPRFGNRSFAEFTFTVPTGTVTTDCALDDAEPRLCSGRFATGYMLDGRHVFQLTTTDTAGQSFAMQVVFTVDTLAPQISLSGRSVHVDSNGMAMFAVFCPPSEPGGCSGSVSVASVPPQRRDRARLVGAASWRAGPDGTSEIGFEVPLWALSEALDARGMPVRVAVIGRDDAGNVTVIRRMETIFALATAVWRKGHNGPVSRRYTP